MRKESAHMIQQEVKFLEAKKNAVEKRLNELNSYDVVEAFRP